MKCRRGYRPREMEPVSATSSVEHTRHGRCRAPGMRGDLQTNEPLALPEKEARESIRCRQREKCGSTENYQGRVYAENTSMVGDTGISPPLAFFLFYRLR